MGDIEDTIEQVNREVSRSLGNDFIQPIVNPSTEDALFVFQTVAGAGGFIAGAIASGRLSNVDERELDAQDILIPGALALAGGSLSAFLLPDGSELD